MPEVCAYVNWIYLKFLQKLWKIIKIRHFVHLKGWSLLFVRFCTSCERRYAVYVLAFVHESKMRVSLCVYVRVCMYVWLWMYAYLGVHTRKRTRKRPRKHENFNTYSHKPTPTYKVYNFFCQKLYILMAGEVDTSQKMF